MSALQNAIDLRLAVGDHVGNRSISDVFPRLVQQAEADLNSKLRTRQQIQTTTLSFEEGRAFLPPDFIELIAVHGLQHGSYEVDAWSIAIPREHGERAVQYYAALPTLSAGPTACNWLLQRHPSVYLYGVGLEAAKFLRDADLATATATLYGNALREVIVADERARWGASVVRVKGFTP